MDKVKFELGQIVYRKIKPGEPIMVTGIMFRQSGTTYWCTTQNDAETSFYECELTAEKSFKESV
jgi:hypothetical protein